MAQLTVYLDKVTLERVTQAAKNDNVSVSQWVKTHLTKTLDETWPSDYFSLFGSLQDEDLERPQQPDWSDDGARETL